MTAWSPAGEPVAMDTPFLFLRKFLREGRRVASFAPRRAFFVR